MTPFYISAALKQQVIEKAIRKFHLQRAQVAMVAAEITKKPFTKYGIEQISHEVVFTIFGPDLKSIGKIKEQEMR